MRPGHYKHRFFELRLGIEQNPDTARLAAMSAAERERHVAGIYMSNDEGKPAVLLCSLAHYEVYTPLVKKKKAPSDYSFALKSQQKMSQFEDPTDGFLFHLYVLNYCGLAIP